jgi:iron-sulfur cluster assembly accessory protein
MGITITDNARRKLAEYLEDQENFLRISVHSGGCSGMTYDAAIDTAMSETDKVVFDDDGIRIVADSREKFFLGGLQIDFSDDLVQSGFRLTNPNAIKSCGCGSSFGL